jgi:hypothetical protein
MLGEQVREGASDVAARASERTFIPAELRFAPPVRRARQGTADRTNVNLVRREGIVPAPEAIIPSELPPKGLGSGNIVKRPTVPISLSERVASILGVEHSLALAQAADGRLCGDKNEDSRVQRRSPASEMHDVAGIDVETCAI